MGLFDVFKKKDCEICGKEVGMFGYKKLEDGEICKDCVKKLSPWFEERRHSTVAQIQEQLAYRAENEKKLADFRVAKVIGDFYKMYIEEVNGIPTRFFVTEAEDYLCENPDIIAFSDLMSCSIDEDSHETELKRDDGNGNKVSYNPPRYETDYNFYVEMQIANNPYFDHIRFRINDSTVTLETRGGSSVSFLGMNFNSGAVNVGSPREQQRYEAYTAMCREIEETVQRSRNTTPQETPVAAPAAQSAGVEPLLKMIEQIKSAPDLGMVFNLQSEIAHQATNLPEFDWIRVKSLTEAAVEDAKQRIIAQESGSAPVQEAPKPKFCPNCGAPAEGGKFCQSCGSQL